MALEGEVNVLGSKVKKKTAAIALGGLVVIGGVVYYRRKRAGSSTTGTSVDTSGSGQIDPATGYVSGSPADQAALQAQNSSGISGLGGSSVGSLGVNPGGSGPTGGQGFTNNAEWALWVEQQVGSTGTDAFAAAIGKYLTGQPLTADQVTSVQEAIAIGNYPPVAGANGSPPSYQTASVPPPPPPPPGNNIRVPNLVGERVENATSALQSLGLKYTFPTRRPNTPYIVTATSPRGGATVKPGSTVHLSIKAELPGRKGGSVPTGFIPGGPEIPA